MKIKLLQLNMWAGTHFPAIKDFLAKNDFDILCFQEVTGVGTRVGNVTSDHDNFQQLKSLLPTHNGELFISQYTSSAPTTGYYGNAIFYKKEFCLKKKNQLWFLRQSAPFPSDAVSFEEFSRNALDLILEKNGKEFHVITAHLTWAKDKYEHPHQREQNIKLVEYMKQAAKPWILAGDFNIDPQQPTVLDLENIGKDLTKAYGIPNTVDPINHTKWENIKPGFPIDYIFVSNDITVEDFHALENVHMSDHLGLVAEIEI